MSGELNRPEEVVAKPCIVEAFDGAVVIECGATGTSLTPAVAHDAGIWMVGEADRAEHDVSLGANGKGDDT